MSSAIFKNSRNFPKPRRASRDNGRGEGVGSTFYNGLFLMLTRVKPRFFSSETRIYTASTISTVAYIIYLYIKTRNNKTISKN